MAEAAEQSGKLNVFISYSRDDLDFADQLDVALKLAWFGTSIDRSIPGAEEWEKRLLAFIRDCDTVVFVTSRRQSPPSGADGRSSERSNAGSASCPCFVVRSTAQVRPLSSPRSIRSTFTGSRNFPVRGSARD